MRLTRLRQGKHSRFIFGNWGWPGVLNNDTVTTVTPSRYAIELRDKNFRLKGRLEGATTMAQWEWNRIGGCGRAVLKVDGNYLRFTIAPDDDIRIYLNNAGSGVTLWYRGYVQSVVPSLDTGNDGSMRLECMGYFGWLDRIIIQDGNAPKTFTSTEVSQIVTSIVDNFVVANSEITRGTIDASTFIPDMLSFKISARDALKTCYDLLGTIEYGVDQNLQFYWRNQSEAVSDKLYLGGNITKLQDRIDFRNIVNKIYFEGGNEGDSVFVATGSSQDSISRYGLHEEIISNGSISTNAVAQRYISGILTQRSKPIRQMSLTLKNTTKRFEASVPMGSIAVVDPDVAQARYLWGTTANGGANRLWGTSGNFGSNTIYGGVRKEQIDRISYTLSPQDGRIDAELQFGNSFAISRASAVLKEIEQIQNSIRQRSL